MFGFSPVGDLTIGGLPTTPNTISISQTIALYDIDQINTPNDTSQLLALSQVIGVGNYAGFNNSDFVAITQANKVGIGVNVSQVLNITSALGFNRSNGLSLSHALSINPTIVVNTPTDGGQSLLFTQSVVVNVPTYLSTAQSLSLVQSNNITASTLGQNALSLSQTVGYVHTVIPNLSQSLALSQIGQFGRAISVTQTLSLAQSLTGQVPFDISQSQTLTFTQSNVYGHGVFPSQTLSIVDTNSAAHAFVCEVNDTLFTLQQYDTDSVTKNLRQVLYVTQSNQFAYGVTQNQTLSLTQSNLLSLLTSIVQSLTLTHSNGLVGNYEPNINHVLSLLDNNTLNVNYSVPNVQTLSFKDYGIANNIYYLVMCNCLNLLSRVTNYVPLSVAQQMTFVWTQVDVQYQYLTLVQTIGTNMDNVSCCNPLGSNNTKDANTTIMLAQNIGCAMSYNLAVTQALNIVTASAWRP